MKNKKLIRISLSLNVVFILGAIFLVFKFYPRKNSSLSHMRQELVAIVEAKLPQDTLPAVFHDARQFEIIGKLPNTPPFERLPPAAEKLIQQPVWELSKNTAGIAVRFKTNSSQIKIRWVLNSNISPSNMTPVASKGLDLYAYSNDLWKFVGVAKPTGNFENEATVITGMETTMQEYLLNLPLYNGVTSLEIGVDKEATIAKPAQKIIDTANPIVFYGTSITQGASASRPGLTYPALLKRQLNKEVINLGFSGNGKFDKKIARYIMTANPSVIVLDCTPNSIPDTIRKNLPQTIDYIASIDDSIPIVLVESIVRDFAFFKKDDPAIFGTFSFIKEQNRALKDIYESKKKTKKNIYYITGEELVGSDREATIDGTHFNDLGHFRAYEFLRREIEKITGH